MPKNKNIKTKVVRSKQLFTQAGMCLMACAATVGILDISGRISSTRVVLPGQTKLAFAFEEDGSNAIRREREEAAPHYISYSTYQRTPGRSGRRD